MLESRAAAGVPGKSRILMGGCLLAAHDERDLAGYYVGGAVAQLGERRVRNAKVEGSIPFRSTNSRLFFSLFRLVRPSGSDLTVRPLCHSIGCMMGRDARSEAPLGSFASHRAPSAPAPCQRSALPATRRSGVGHATASGQFRPALRLPERLWCCSRRLAPVVALNHSSGRTPEGDLMP
jgi:hypothetical protein